MHQNLADAPGDGRFDLVEDIERLDGSHALAYFDLISAGNKGLAFGPRPAMKDAYKRSNHCVFGLFRRDCLLLDHSRGNGNNTLPGAPLWSFSLAQHQARAPIALLY